MRRRTSGRVGRGGGPASPRGPTLFSPKPQVLEEGERELAQEHVVVQPGPGPSLEVAEAEFPLELLVHLLARPTGLDPRREGLERQVGSEIC